LVENVVPPIKVSQQLVRIFLGRSKKIQNTIQEYCPRIPKLYNGYSGSDFPVRNLSIAVFVIGPGEKKVLNDCVLN